MDVNFLRSGYLEVCVGPMFSGKTSRLLSQLSKLADTGYNVLLINHAIDDRSISVVSTHSSQFKKVSPKIDAVKVGCLEDADISQYEVIGIDEGQFFTDLCKVVDWVDQDNKMVFISSLDGDSQRKPFGKVLQLVTYADKFEKICAKCHHCTDLHKKSHEKMMYRLVVDSPFTARTNAATEQIHVGGSESYVSLCRYHYLKCKMD